MAQPYLVSVRKWVWFGNFAGIVSSLRVKIDTCGGEGVRLSDSGRFFVEFRSHRADRERTELASSVIGSTNWRECD